MEQISGEDVGKEENTAAATLEGTTAATRQKKIDDAWAAWAAAVEESNIALAKVSKAASYAAELMNEPEEKEQGGEYKIWQA